jgi:hypothetical protein
MLFILLLPLHMQEFKSVMEMANRQLAHSPILDHRQR